MTKFQFSKRVPAKGNDAVGSILAAAADPKIISFAGGLPAPELFPVNEMQAAVDKVFEQHGREAMQYGAAKGVTALRETILDHVAEKDWAGAGQGKAKVAPALTIHFYLLPNKTMPSFYQTRWALASCPRIKKAAPSRSTTLP